ncbi:hypothetical protein [Neorhizobium sp. T25_27]|uniref:hypothetical protein n=1 Tax=Neorhizobium sp. T25_27 TaxID=2093831 RepID=UPI000CF8D8A5|nr:hypothetical protein [Neorhizobium sp. T25_27]
MAKHPDEIVGDVVVALLRTAADFFIDSIFLLRPTLKRVGLERKLNSYFGEMEVTVDQRIQKIDLARDNLAEALSAMDELKSSAEENRAELQRLQVALEKATAEKQDLSAYNQDLRKLAELEAESVRRALGMPTPREVLRSKVISFFAGVLVTILLSLLYDFAAKPLFLWAFPSLKGG